MKFGGIFAMLAALVVTAVSTMSFAQDTKLFKTLDGAVVYCNGNTEASEFGAKQVFVELTESNNSEKSHEPALKISVVKCQDSKWVTDAKPGFESYVAPNGARVEVEYSNYEALVLNNEEQVVTQLGLENLATAGIQNFAVSLNKTKENPQNFEILVRATKTVKSSDGYNSTELITFGTFRIQFTK